MAHFSARRASCIGALALAAAFGVADGVASEPAPRIVLTAPLGGQTTERVVTIAGRVERLAIERLTLVVNGIPMSVAVQNGTFSQPQVLSPGTNSIRAFAEANGATIEDSTSVFASVPSKDLRVTLTWDTPGTDVDLWVTGPDGEKVFYGHRNGSLGGSLDTDVTTGFGPETFTLARLWKGAWRIQAHYYGGPTPTWIEVNVIEREGQADEARRTFRGLLVASGDVLEVGEVLASR